MACKSRQPRILRRWFAVGVVLVVLLAVWLILRPMVAAHRLGRASSPS